MFSDAAMFLRFARGLRHFLNTPLSPQDCRRVAQEQIANRESSFLRLLEQGVYGVPTNPYRALLNAAGAEYGDVAKMVRADGVEETLDKLHKSGVYVTLDEFKARRAIRRGSLEIPVTAENFDNPILPSQLTVESSGSSGKPRRLPVDLEILRHDAAWAYLHFAGMAILGRPLALWRPVPPGSSGIKNALYNAKIGHPPERWFTATHPGWRFDRLQSCVFGKYAVWSSRSTKNPLPVPEYTPTHDAIKVARWLGEKRRERTPAIIDAPSSVGTRVALAARENGIDISESFFRVGGEPVTKAKTAILGELGCRFSTNWAMAEISRLAYGCCNREVDDEMHFLTGKLAIRQQDLDIHGEQVGAFYVTTLHANTPKIMLNTEMGDSGVLTNRRCGCPLEQAGLKLHVHTLRSYEKLTTAGSQFLGSDFVRLVEEVLPGRFGGAATDYQFREESGQHNLPRVSIIVSPRVGAVANDKVIAQVTSFLGTRSRGDRRMAESWLESGTLRVVRGEPEVLSTGKTPPLRVHRT